MNTVIKKREVLCRCIWLFVSFYGAVAVWANPIQTIRMPEKSEIDAMAFSPDQETIAVAVHRFANGSVDPPVEIWDWPLPPDQEFFIHVSGVTTSH